MSYATLDSARTASRGQGQIMLAPSVYVGNDDRLVNLDLAYRRGVTDRLDLGFRLSLFGALGELKYQLRQSPDPTWGVDVAISPGVGFGTDITWWDSGGDPDSPSTLQFALPLLVGFNLGDYQLTLTPQLRYQLVPTLPSGVLNVGGTIAFGKMAAPGFQIYPAVAIWKAVDPANFRHSLLGPGLVVAQPALVFRW
jgi:hypothetical protein